MKKLENINKILLITLSNIGDVVLTTPVVDVLDRNFPNAAIDIMVGPNAADVFAKDKRINKTVVYDKYMKISRKFSFLLALRVSHYDLVVDLKNTLFPFLLNSRFSSSPFKKAPKDIVMMRERHLWKLESLGLDVNNAKISLMHDESDKNYIDDLLKKNSLEVSGNDRVVCLCPGAKSHTKRWSKDKFIQLCERLTSELGCRIIFIGDESDKEIIKNITSNLTLNIFDFSGLTSIPQLGYLISKTSLLITNDSAPMHIAGSTDTPVIAIFGPTDPDKYGPSSLGGSKVMRKSLECAPCEVALCKSNHECMEQIGVDEVFNEARNLLIKK